MKMRFCLLTICVALPVAASAADFKFPDQTLTVPDGFEVELIAGPPLVNRPIAADFDEEGHLYIADSSGSNEKSDKQLEQKPHRIVRLTDTDGDGRFDQSTVFADKMMFPEGAMWLNGSLYVGAPPSIWKLTDTDGDGVADKREEWMQAKTLTGCANDLHGPYAGPDGWIYWCKGAFAQQTWERPGRKPFVTRAAHIFRCRPDGTGVEPVMTGGMDNPVEVAFTAGGERIFSTTFFQNPGGGKRDGLVHAVYGGVYGKVNDVVDDHAQTGGLMPVLTHFGAAAPCGLMRYESDVFGSDYQNDLFTCSFNMHKVIRSKLIPNGATFKTVDSDFLKSDNADFHPTDVLEDADGSLIVLNTGGWYKLCCPTSQLAKPDVLGGVYRIRRKGAPKIADPRGRNATTPFESLGDKRPAVRKRAIAKVAAMKEKAVPTLVSLLQSTHDAAAQHGIVLALTRIDGTDARAALRMATRDKDPETRQLAFHGISLWRDGGAVEEALLALRDSDAQVRRVAAEALGRMGDNSTTEPLLAAAGKVNNDRFLEHSIIFALIEIGDKIGLTAGLSASTPQIRKAALIALDQLGEGDLSPNQVVSLLGASDPVLKETATWLVGKHRDWGPSLRGYLRIRLSTPDLNGADAEELQTQLTQFVHEPLIQTLLANTVADPQTPKASRALALRLMARANLKETPAEWPAEISNALASKDVAMVREAVGAARAMVNAKKKDANVLAALSATGRNAKLPADLRIEALAASPTSGDVEPELFHFMLEQVAPNQPVAVRSAAAAALAKAKLGNEQLATLTEVFRTAGPFEVVKLLGAFDNVADDQLGAKLLAALRESKGIAAIRAENLKPHLTKFSAGIQTQADELLASLNSDSTAQKQRLEELLPKVKGGDIRRGQLVFNSPKAACSSCHAMGYLGGNVGPDLTSIGTIRTERDLLESILFPSASFVRSYEPVMALTKSGDQFNGILRKDSPEEIVLVTGPDAETRIARTDLAELRPSTVSVMPQGLDQQLTTQELADLVTFLKNTKWGAQ